MSQLQPQVQARQDHLDIPDAFSKKILAVQAETSLPRPRAPLTSGIMTASPRMSIRPGAGAFGRAGLRPRQHLSLLSSQVTDQAETSFNYSELPSTVIGFFLAQDTLIGFSLC